MRQRLRETVNSIEVAGEIDDERRNIPVRLPLERLGKKLDG